MKKRIITGIVYVLVVVLCLALKVLIPDYGDYAFDAMFWAVSLIGSFEFLRAVKKVPVSHQCVCYAFAICAVPLYVFVGLRALLLIASVTTVLYAILFVFDFKNTSFTGMLYAVCCSMYVTGLSLVCVALNHMKAHSQLAMLFMFITVPLTDSFAYIFGMLFGRYLPYRLAPDVSPKKTVVGAFGGLIGGMIGGVICYFLAPYFDGSLELWRMLVAGPSISIFSQVGDLFESAIKRRCDVKDMGKLLPGHGGILDRFDSTLFASIIMVALFTLV